MVKLSILICHLPKRAALLTRLRRVLDPQVTLPLVEVRIHDQVGITVGEKRNRLLQDAKGEYITFIDDDDWISHNYVSLLMEGIFKGVDCCSLVGQITTDGNNPKKFIHSRAYVNYFEDKGVYYRPPNHLNCIKASIAKQFSFPTKNHGEDTDWAMQIARAKVLKTEHRINDIIYFYDYKTTKGKGL